VQLLDILHSEKKLTLVFEYLHSDLRRHLDTNVLAKRDPQAGEYYYGQSEDTMTRALLYQLLQGVAYCHAKLVLHRDLKPHNLLISRNGRLKLADFGLARPFGAPVRAYSSEVVTLWYRAPDVLLGSRYYSTSIDSWSIGCIFAEMATGQPMAAGGSVEEQLLRIQAVLGTPTAATWPDFEELLAAATEARIITRPRAEVFPNLPRAHLPALYPKLDADGLDLLARFLRYNPDERISAEAALKHRYFDSVRDQRRFRAIYCDGSSSDES